MCGWEEFVDKGIQEGFVAKLKKDYGFISKDFPTEKHPTGIYFNKSNLRGTSITQLNVGDRVHFVVGQNNKGGCVAKKIEVQGQLQFAPQVIFSGIGKRRKLMLLFLSLLLSLSSSLLKTNEVTAYWSSNNSSHVAITIISF